MQWSKGAGLARWLHVAVAGVARCMSLFVWLDAGCVGCIGFVLWWVQKLHCLVGSTIQGSVVMGSVIMVATIVIGRVCCMSYLPL